MNRPWHSRLLKIWRKVALRMVTNGFREHIPRLMMWVQLGTFTGGNTLNYFIPASLKEAVKSFDPDFKFHALNEERREACCKRRRRRGKQKRKEDDRMNRLAKNLTELLAGAVIERVDAVPNPAMEKFLVIIVTLSNNTKQGIIVESDSEGNGPGFLRTV